MQTYLWIALATWLAANAADEYSSWYGTRYADLVERDALLPLRSIVGARLESLLAIYLEARDPRTHKFAVVRGLVGKAIFLGTIALFGLTSWPAAAGLAYIHAGVVAVAAFNNVRLIRADVAAGHKR